MSKSLKNGADSEWIVIQQKTFKRWCNEILKRENQKIEDLAEDFSDGVLLITLLEVLSNKKAGQFNKKPQIHAQREENVQLSLDFIKREGIHVTIGSGDIVNGNLKLILDLIWTLILHYQVSMAVDTNNDEIDGGTKDTQSPMAKSALLEWLQKKIPDKTFNNFTKDWNDGTLIAALVDAMAPGLCPEHNSMDPSNCLQNASHAMKLAEDWLDVPQLLDPEDMTNSSVDELSMITYLSQFPDAKLKPGAPLNQTINADQSNVKIHGPGVEKDGLTTSTPSAEFVVDTRESEASAREIEVAVIGPDKVPVPVNVLDNGDGTYKCSYEPKDVGKYTVNVYYNEKPAGESPYSVVVSPSGVQMAVLNRLGAQLANMFVDAFNSGTGDFNVGLNFGLSARNQPSHRQQPADVNDSAQPTSSNCD